MAHLLGSLLLALLGVVSAQHAHRGCKQGYAWSEDLGDCKLCSICTNKPKSDFCQYCFLQKDSTQNEITFNSAHPHLVIALGVSGAIILLSLVMGLALALKKYRVQNNFSVPIEETGGPTCQGPLLNN
ncbi:tumor necrosis factor receptor superfamily member 12A-like [Latimeria chalumnae]|uniref:tumor necrosis factor receptor superfamily member 12A-like n=1 Tax=Latimeria chalumnae TaxID=7897 RepID=UPI00313E8B66